MMTSQGLPVWVQELIDKGESMTNCLAMYREMQAAEREMKKVEREMKKAEMECDVKLRELEVREKELIQGIGHGAGSKSDTLKSKLPKFQEGQDPDVFLRSFEKLVTLHKIHKSEWPRVELCGYRERVLCHSMGGKNAKGILRR